MCLANYPELCYPSVHIIEQNYCISMKVNALVEHCMFCIILHVNNAIINSICLALLHELFRALKFILRQFLMYSQKAIELETLHILFWYFSFPAMDTQQQFVFNGNNIPHTMHMPGNRDPVGFTPAAVSTPGARLMVTDEDYYRMLQSHRRKRTNREVSQINITINALQS